ncbi:MAG: hypothetical protein WCD44_00415 [Candidatus Babeliales bacterium]
MIKKTYLGFFIFGLNMIIPINFVANEEQEKESTVSTSEKIQSKKSENAQEKSSAKIEHDIRNLIADIAKYKLHNPVLLRNPNLRHLHPLQRLSIPYKPAMDRRYP